ncbi:unnamed protein product [Owenia fusiformis]|uniref:Proton-coupled folate transporter n=1 Tax=Owenia fusiformis TaxID=6347 RepID=A0A8S4PQN2_OWEFU|nr:unnamed protein product [Owenia fusiformis]
MAQSMLEPTARLFIYETTCKQGFTDTVNKTVCGHLKEFPEYENMVQELSAEYLMAYKVLLNVPVIILSLFCGAWSDKVGRKLPIMLPCLGNIFSVLLYMLGSAPRMPTMVLIMIGSGLSGIFGKSAVITMALHSYVADVTDKANRTRRLGKLLGMNFFGYCCGSLLAGALLEVVNFNVIFTIVTLINGIAVMVTLCCMEESVQNPQTAFPSGDQKPTFLFKLTNMRDSLLVVFKRRENNARCYICMLFFIIVAHQTCKSGEQDISMLYVKRSPLDWPRSWYGYLLAIEYAASGLAQFFMLPILTNVLKLKDSTIIMTGITFKFTRLMMISFADKSWMVYLSMVIGGPTSLIVAGVKSILSKTVHEDEIGKTFSLLSCGETLSNLFGSIIINNIYVATVNIYPGFAFLLDAAFYFILFIIMLLLARDMDINAQYGLLKEFSPSCKSESPDENIDRSSVSSTPKYDDGPGAIEPIQPINENIGADETMHLQRGVIDKRDKMFYDSVSKRD